LLQQIEERLPELKTLLEEGSLENVQKVKIASHEIDELFRELPLDHPDVIIAKN
jgi:hypothetical protein